MLDFANALYLGLRHPSMALGEWDALTLGRPAASSEPPGAAQLAAALALLCGCEAATLLPSTLHLFCDLFELMAQTPVAILVDGASYPIARIGAERAAAKGTPLTVFAHADVGAARRLAQAARRQGRRPLILADGYSPGAAQAPPLAAYAALAREAGGWLVLDDTQVIGLFGRGGGGSLRRHGIKGSHVVVGSSLSKAFGAPLAVLCASADLVRRFGQSSQARVHSSPPSVASIRAALAALRINRAHGDQLRRRLWCRVAQWRAGAARHGIALRASAFPVQTLALDGRTDGVALHACLRSAGVDAVLQRAGTQATLSFIVTARHAPDDIERALALLAACLRAQSGSVAHTRREYEYGI
ncbi:aminotransferase class I/II-fold pyridoxal phosphate-dependent enzyme [Massilia antarctica]|uniref:aminotransferase class I/II-fold pyridoxal phosphate-dependent enzyme n=1 Tax=Massilia antarctica TaxID=2765360 RepID=UPI0006BB5C3E|nr:aminotransferase class I/II-fold pyridoxal phosphate-dependent enzyme [Massilia sp. H27-R4]MCY0913845.1 aminotransferase class I/II-fold pyridoxal phosphate-dependent enzyme [Massilia sp. H27-R4]CUI04425.1 8-amino-7-oxononanoate synthase [Janthinobacterium sp. CG23_2]CUU28211.1 8-amino-7-oxononanoate synthase [Janthinobacterium sp. CG23_2]